MTVSTSGARHLLLRMGEPARLPSAMLTVLRDEVVLAGWMRASGVLSEVQIRVGTAPARTIAGPVQVVMLEGSVGLSNGDVSCGLRVVIAHETDDGVIETVAGDLLEARVNAMEIHVTAFDEVIATRQLDASGVWLLDATSASVPAAATPPPRPVATTAPATPPQVMSFSAAVRASEALPPPLPAAPAAPPAPPPPAPPPIARPSPTFSMGSNAMPTRIAKPVLPEEEDQAVPEPGDIVEHFAFGRCEVVKTDGDRLHLRLPKDQRIKEIALEMLRVELIPPVEGETSKHYKLARKL